MRPLTDLKYGFTDAENYKRRENRDTFNQIFLRTEELNALQEPSTFFLVGEKGTGKTAYAVYLTNTPNEERVFSHKFIRETHYLKFISLKQTNSLSLSNYVDIWKVIILNMIAASILEHEPKPIIMRNNKFDQLRSALQKYDHEAFTPEVISGLQIAENASEILKVMLGIKTNSIAVESTLSESVTYDRKIFQTSLLNIERSFESAIGSLSLRKNHIVFIDGIDLRPESVPFDEYLSCIKGLANALWALNNDFFPSIRDSKGRCRVIALLRPDIFNSMGLQNRNTKLKDNSVVLDWRTQYGKYRQSKLFKVADRFFRVQQEEEVPEGASWNHYFPFDASETKQRYESPSSFITILRYTFHRPRDIFAMLDTLNAVFVQDHQAIDYFTIEQITSREFRLAYGRYMLGEVKDSLSFYYDESEYELFLKFFEYLDGHAKFDYAKFLSAYVDFRGFVDQNRDEVPDFMESAERFLQFLYDQNIICHIENAGDEKFIRWCFIERSPSNISPKVKLDAQYEIHYSLGNALNTGKKLKSGRKGATGIVKPSKSGFFEGVIKLYKGVENYGFIVQDGMPVDVFFHSKRVVKGTSLRKGSRVKFRLEKDPRGRLITVDIMDASSI